MYMSTRTRLDIAVGGLVKVTGIKVYLCHVTEPTLLVCIVGTGTVPGGGSDNLLFTIDAR